MPLIYMLRKLFSDICMQMNWYLSIKCFWYVLIMYFVIFVVQILRFIIIFIQWCILAITHVGKTLILMQAVGWNGIKIFISMKSTIMKRLKSNFCWFRWGLVMLDWKKIINIMQYSFLNEIPIGCGSTVLEENHETSFSIWWLFFALVTNMVWAKLCPDWNHVGWKVEVITVRKKRDTRDLADSQWFI